MRQRAMELERTIEGMRTGKPVKVRPPHYPALLPPPGLPAVPAVSACAACAACIVVPLCPFCPRPCHAALPPALPTVVGSAPDCPSARLPSRLWLSVLQEAMEKEEQAQRLRAEVGDLERQVGSQRTCLLPLSQPFILPASLRWIGISDGIGANDLPVPVSLLVRSPTVPCRPVLSLSRPAGGRPGAGCPAQAGRGRAHDGGECTAPQVYCPRLRLSRHRYFRVLQTVLLPQRCTASQLAFQPAFHSPS